MPFILLVMGVFLVVSAVQGTQTQLWNLVSGDYSGPNNFWYWTIAIFVIGGIGYSKKAQPFANGFLGLILLVLVLRKANPGATGGGFFSEFTAAIQGTTTPTAAASSSAAASTSTAAPAATGGLPALPALTPIQPLAPFTGSTGATQMGSLA